MAKKRKRQTNPDAQLISIEQWARKLNVSKDSAYREVTAGRIPTVRIGRRRMIDVVNDHPRYIEQRKSIETA